MGLFYLAHIDQAVTTGTASGTAVWALTNTSRLLHIWQIALTTANLGAAGAAGARLALRFQREAAGLLTGGAAGVVTPTIAGTTASSAATLFAAGGLTGAPVATERLHIFSMHAEVAGVSIPFLVDPVVPNHAADRPLFTLRTNQQLALVLAAAAPAAGTYQISGHVLFEEV